MRHLVFDVSGKRRSIARAWWEQLEGPKPGDTFSCNGCSCSPDVWRGYAIWPACVIHDYHYGTGVLGDSWRARQRADAIMRRNIQTLIRLDGGRQHTAVTLSWIYWGRVRVWGANHYQGLKKRRSFWKRLGEAWFGGE